MRQIVYCVCKTSWQSSCVHVTVTLSGDRSLQSIDNIHTSPSIIAQQTCDISDSRLHSFAVPYISHSPLGRWRTGAAHIQTLKLKCTWVCRKPLLTIERAQGTARRASWWRLCFDGAQTSLKFPFLCSRHCWQSSSWRPSSASKCSVSACGLWTNTGKHACF